MGKSAGKSVQMPKHKPSRKVALEEVLVSLQDLIQNEFADEAENESVDTPPKSAGQADTPNVLNKGANPARKRGRPRKHPHPDASRSARSEPESYSYSQEQAELFGEPPTAETNTANSGAKTALTDAIPAAKKKSAEELETTQNRANLRIVSNPKPVTQPETDSETMATKSSNTAESLTDQAPLDWADDIPVLTEAVDPEVLGMGKLQDMVDQSLADKSLTPEARDIAVKVAARLNIEARQSGGEQLDIKTIMRLQALLKEALEPKD